MLLLSHNYLSQRAVSLLEVSMIGKMLEEVIELVKGFKHLERVTRKHQKYGGKFTRLDHSLDSKVWKEEEWVRNLFAKICKKKLIE